MLHQAVDFRDESEALHALLMSAGDVDLDTKTLFKNWTFTDIIRHLHFWNFAADLSLTDEAAFLTLIEKVQMEKRGLRAFETSWFGDLDGAELLKQWRSLFVEMSNRFEGVDPKKRLKWAGPDMSARSSITARLMETWAHGQAVYDALGVERQDTDRIRNIAHLGVNTFGWTYATRGREPPTPIPFVSLTGPSGAVWEWNQPDDENFVKGNATDFCQVVTQVRNIADTTLDVRGDVAIEWMLIAQCFAGPPVAPPSPGVRRRAQL